ncbi:hypothetical protein QJS10_CPA01g00056 [Acorus calamus]|uniref:Uncharacterized protein n=1 Tax=Acorus calamus TaxID=4465 RepID=A0AAV9FL68_ACOCL|nr:hypothetical protein QJS10_CPA01g00056 [Acorus calamus]
MGATHWPNPCGSKSATLNTHQLCSKCQTVDAAYGIHPAYLQSNYRLGREDIASPPPQLSTHKDRQSEKDGLTEINHLWESSLRRSIRGLWVCHGRHVHWSTWDNSSRGWDTHAIGHMWWSGEVHWGPNSRDERDSNRLANHGGAIHAYHRGSTKRRQSRLVGWS